MVAKPAAAIHLDAAWDKTHRAVTRIKMVNAEESLSDIVNFGEVDCDRDPELAKSIPIVNVPSVAYYRAGKLVGVIIGEAQDIRVCLERVLLGDPIR